MKNHKCSEIKQLLSPYIDNELTKEEQKLVSEHLENCSDCSNEYAELVELKKIMEEIGKEEIDAPEGFAQSVMEEIEKENIVPASKGKATTFVDKFFLKPWIPAVIAAMLLVIVYVPDFLGSNSYDESIEEKSALNNEATFTTKAVPEESAPAPDSRAELRDSQKSMDAMSPESAPAPEDRKIIRNGYVSADVSNYQETETNIIKKTQELGGYIAGSNSYYYGENQDLLAGNLNIRIPEHYFDQVMNFIETTGKITSSSTSTNDVTEEFFDANTRINNLRIKEERLLEILSKQGDLKDLLEVEKELANTRSEIERLEGRLNFLSGQVAYSTINLDLKEVRNLEDTISKDSVTGIGSRVKEAMIKSVNLMIDLGVKGVIFISSALPFLLILVIIYFVLRAIWNKKNRDL